MKQKILIIALIISIGVNLGVLSIFLYHLWKGNQVEHPLQKLMKKLALTPEQKEKMKAERENFEQKTKPIKDELAYKRGEVFGLLQEAEVNAEERDRLFSEITQLQMELQLLAFEHISRVKQILNPEQQELFFQHLEGKLYHKGEDHPPAPFPPGKFGPPFGMEGPLPEIPPPPPFDEGK